jgi:hypothetical protein
MLKYMLSQVSFLSSRNSYEEVENMPIFLRGDSFHGEYLASSKSYFYSLG